MEEKKELTKKVEEIVLIFRSLFYILSVIYPLFGIIAGIVLQNRQFSPEIKKIGEICLWIGIIVVIIIGVIALTLFKLLAF